MPKTVNRTPKKQTPAPEAEEQNIFQALGLEEKPEPTVAKGASGGEPSTADLLKQLQEMNSRIERAEAANLALTQNVSVTPTIKEPPAVSYEGLPDPVSDPDGYGRELHKRIADNLNATQAYRNDLARANQNAADKYAQLWDDFAIQYEDAAEDPDTIEIIAASIVKKAQRRGIDPDRYMFGNRDKFLQDVYAEYSRIYGKKDEASEEGDEMPQTRRSKAPPADESDDEPGRTGGIFGGNESGGAPSVSRVKAGDMVKDIQDMQRRTGFW